MPGSTPPVTPTMAPVDASSQGAPQQHASTSSPAAHPAHPAPLAHPVHPAHPLHTAHSPLSTPLAGRSPSFAPAYSHPMHLGNVSISDLASLTSTRSSRSADDSLRRLSQRAMSADGASLRSVSRLPRVIVPPQGQNHSVSPGPSSLHAPGALSQHHHHHHSDGGRRFSPHAPDTPPFGPGSDAMSNYSRSSLYRAFRSTQHSISSSSSSDDYVSDSEEEEEEEDDNRSNHEPDLRHGDFHGGAHHYDHDGEDGFSDFEGSSVRASSRASSRPDSEQHAAVLARPGLPRRRSKACDSILDPSDHLHSAFEEEEAEEAEPPAQVAAPNSAAAAAREHVAWNVAPDAVRSGPPPPPPPPPATEYLNSPRRTFFSSSPHSPDSPRSALSLAMASRPIPPHEPFAADPHSGPYSGMATPPLPPPGASFEPDSPAASTDLFSAEHEKRAGSGAAGGSAGAFPGKGSGASFWARHKKLCIFLLVLLIVAILAAILIPIGVVVVAGNNDNKDDANSTKTAAAGASASSSAGASATTKGSPKATATALPDSMKNTIYDVSTWLDTTDFNTTFTSETVGGLPVMGLYSTWNDSARPNEHVPPLDEDFKYGERPLRGVNVGGWLILEPFLTPSYFESYNLSLGIVDEWTLSGHIRDTQGDDALKTLLETHYSTFVNETTFKEIAEAGLDHVRIPYGYWAVRTYDNDTFLPQVSWRYLLRGIEWARKYGLRVKVDLHSVPGGQNGWNHSGRQNHLTWLNGTSGEENGQRSLEVHKQLSEFFAQDRYKNVVSIYGLVNEPRMTALNVTRVDDWTETAYDLVEEDGYGGYIVYGDGFVGVDAWKGVFNQTDFPKLVLDVHQYTIFDPNLISMTHSGKINYVCSEWKNQLNRSSNPLTGHGATFVGEWSQADNDCTLYLNNVGVGSRWEGDFNPGTAGTEAVLTPSCAGGTKCSCAESVAHPSEYSTAYKQFLLDFAEAQMQVFEENSWGFIYWNWDTETYNATQWSYKKGREYGILPQLAYERTFNCTAGTPDYLTLGLAETY